MMKFLIIIAAVIALTGCGKEQRRADFVQRCIAAEFTARQCDLLFAMTEDISDANSSAALATMNSGTAIGLSSGR